MDLKHHTIYDQFKCSDKCKNGQKLLKLAEVFYILFRFQHYERGLGATVQYNDTRDPNERANLLDIKRKTTKSQKSSAPKPFLDRWADK